MKKLLFLFILVFGTAIAVFAQPSNDERQNAITLPVGLNCTPVQGTTEDATFSIGICDPEFLYHYEYGIKVNGPSSGYATDDVWYKFIATSNSVNVEVNSNSYARIDFFRHSCTSFPYHYRLAGFLEKEHPYYVSIRGRHTLDGLKIGITYYIRISETDGNSIDFDICVKPVPILNDHPDQAELLIMNAPFTYGSLVGSTRNPKWRSSCDPHNQRWGDVWYKFVAIESTANIVVSGAIDGIDLHSRIPAGLPDIISCNGEFININRVNKTVTLSKTNLVIGQTYYVAVWGEANFTIVVKGGPPVNDECVNAITLPTDNLAYYYDAYSNGATQSMAAATPCNGNPDDDVWFKFKATNTSHTISVEGFDTSRDYVIDLRTGGCNGTSLACQKTFKNSDNYFQQLTSTNLTVGETYYIRVYDYGPYGSNFAIKVLSPPENDLCTNAVEIVNAAPVNGVFSGASTTESFVCNGSNTNGNKDVWYRFKANQAEHQIKVTPSANADVSIELREGSCNGNVVFCANGQGMGVAETIDTYGLAAGYNYYIRVILQSSTGTYANNTTFNIEVMIPPKNDELGTATLIFPQDTCIANPKYRFIGSTPSTAFTSSCLGTSQKDLWYVFTATNTQQSITVNSTNGLYVGMEVTRYDYNLGLVTIGCLPNLTNQTQTLTFQSDAFIVGGQYYIRLIERESGGANWGMFNICITSPPPPNDICQDAIMLTPQYPNNPIYGTTFGANRTIIDGSCSGAANNDVWYKFVATVSNHKIVVYGLNAPIAMELLDGSCNGGSTLTCQNTGNDIDYTSSGLVVGKTYFIRVFSLSEQTEPAFFTIGVSFSSLPNDHCEGAIQLTTNLACNPVVGTSLGGTQTFSPAYCNGFNTDYPDYSDDDVMFKFVAINSTQTIKVQSASDFNAVIQLRNACVNYQEPLGAIISCANNTGIGGLETLTINNLTVGSTYYIQLYDKDAGGGNFTICLTTPCLPKEYLNSATTPGPFAANKVIQASESVIAGNEAFPLGITPSNSNNLTLRAGKSVILSPGITINQGAVFKAEIGGCQ